MTTSRLEQLRMLMEQAGLDSVALNPGATLTYLTGVRFHLMERPVVLLVPRRGDPVVVLPEFETPKVADFPFAVKTFPYDENPEGWDAVFRKAAASLGLDGRTIGVEPRQLRLLELRYIRGGAAQTEFPDASEALASLRLRKDESEVQAMRSAVKIAQDALETALSSFKLGMSEREFAGTLTVELFRHGSDAELPFAPIVSGGPNSANAHASPSERPISRGDLLVVDWGAASDGYISDLTRTFAIGEPDPELRKIADVVHAANVAGRDAGRPGVPCANVDLAARAVIEKAGYGEYFTHRTGHGIGMEAHEEPYMRGDNMHMLYPGMAYTVEPGIYLPGRGGVRIEDDVVVTKTGVEVLSDLPRELRILG
jgi:Xaa-Pro aminopeptidase